MKAIAFDGVLVFSEKEKFRFLQKTASEFGVNISDNLFAEMVSSTTKEFVSKSFKY